MTARDSSARLTQGRGRTRRPDLSSRLTGNLSRVQASIARDAGFYPFGHVLEHPAVPGGPGDGTLNFGNSNYLGLSTHPEVVEAAQRAIRRYGTSSAGPRLFNGTLTAHLELEHELADFYGKQAAVIFQSGYTANVAMLSSLLTRRDLLLLDRHSHISQREGAERAGIPIVTFRHNDPASLHRRIASIAPHTGFAVCLDGVFSMDGSIAPLAAIAEAVSDGGGSLLVDEAHALGVIGAGGRGAAEHHGCLPAVTLISVSLSKALAGLGGALIGDKPVIEYIALTARSYIFTASCDPGAVAAALESLRILRRTPELPAAVRRNGRRLRQAVTEAGWRPVPGDSPIVAIPVHNRISAVLAWRSLMDNGVYVNVAIPPAVPERDCLLRVVATAQHTEHDMERLHDALAMTRNKLRKARNYAEIIETAGSAQLS